MDDDDIRPLLSENSPSANENTKIRSSNRNLFLSCGAVLFGALSLGIILGMSSPMIPDMQKDDSPNALKMTKSDYSWFGSLITLGAMVGGLAGGGLIQIWGRKLTAMLCGIPFVGGMLLMSYASNVVMLMLGRTITGVAGGIASLVVPTYISETSTSNLRGLLGSCNQLVITLGIFLAYALGIALSWRWLALVCAVPGALLTLFCAFIPETPRYLLVNHKRREARRSLLVLRRGQEAVVDAELEILEESISHVTASVPWAALFRDPVIRTPLLLSLGVMFFQQMGGINPVMFYSETIFYTAGFTSDSMIHVALLLVAGVQVIFTGISCLIMDKAGRKILLMVSGSVMCVSAGTFGLYFQLTGTSNSTGPSEGFEYSSELLGSTGSQNLSWLALLSVMLFIAAFAIGLGPVPWLLLSEIIPVAARGKASGLSTAVNWMLAFLVTKEFHDMQETFTTQGTFWIFSGVCLIGVIYHGALLPETKGKTLEEISAYFSRGDERRSGSDSSIAS